MKKFYYKKGESLDRTPIILRLERRHTIDTNLDGAEDEQRQISERAASISSLDQLTGVPTIPRAKTREVAKSLSEDALSKGQTTEPKRVITEAELSSSWLYKSMQASVNSRFKSPNKSPFKQAEDLAPVTLQDPKMKPVPVKSSRSERSCFIHFATVMAISICTVGFLALITGIIYMEVFANKNLTSHETPDTPMDLSEIVLDSQGHNELTTHDLLIEEEQQTLQKSFRKKIDSKAINSPLNETEDKKGTNARMMDIEESDMKELSRYMNSTQTKIKFQDGETVIYEVKSTNAMEYESSDVLDNFRGRSFEDFNNTENKNESDVTEEKMDGKLENLETFLDSEFDKLKDRFDLKNKGATDGKLRDSTSVGNQKKDDSIESVSDDLKPRADSEISVKRNESPVKMNESEIFHSDDIGPRIVPDTETNHVFHGKNKIEMIDGVEKIEQRKSNDLHGASTKERTQESRLEQHKVSPSVQYVDLGQEIESEHDVDSMVEVVDDPEENTVDTILSNRKGLIYPFKTSTDKPNANPTSMKTEKHSMIENNEPQSIPQGQVTKEPIVSMRPVDMKVSLAEAMKHLQVLDVNNKILTSRIKPIKRNGDSTKKIKQSNISRNEEDTTLEKMRYLQKVRLLLYEHLQ